MKLSLFAVSTSLLLSTVSAIVPGKHFDRIVTIVMSDANYDDAFKDPYFSSLAKKHNGITLTNYGALAQPSQPNYVGMISGSVKGVHLDFDSNISNRKSVVDLLEDKNISWKTYQESYPDDGKCHTDSSIGDYYVRKHNPFMSFTNISGNTKRCVSHIVPLSQLDKDIANDQVPQYVFITPNMINDSRDSDVTKASQWFREYIELRLKEPAFTKNTLFVLTWDKQETVISLDNHVLTVLFGPMVNRYALTDSVNYDHYSILKTVQDNWDLPSLGQNDVEAAPFVLKDLAENGASEKIKNVVILLFENRSFDRMMGWFKYNKEIDGLTGKECNYVNPSDPKSLKICATNNGLLKDPLDPPHGYDAVTHQLTGNPNLPSDSVKKVSMGGFVADFAKEFPNIKDNATALHQVMDGFDPSSIPITYELATNYTIVDRWFSSFPGSTLPNRLFAASATSNGEVHTDGWKYPKGYPQRTIFNNLADAKIDWSSYYNEIPSLLVLSKLRLGSLHHYKNWSRFKKDAANGKLSPVNFIDPAYFSLAKCIVENDAHPPSDVADAEKLLKEVYETIRASPQWNSTLFIVTFDEHGGYYDHVDTPLYAPNPDGKNFTDPDGKDTNFNFDRLGVRVPAILISPWVKKGAVIHEPKGPFENSQYEHSSIPATIKKLFNLPKFLTKRDEWAGTFENAVSLDKPRQDCPLKLSDPPAPVVNGTITNPLEKAICDALRTIIQGEKK
ncbi:phosphoesterase [Cunninghamella echinulata]|nr:phosphoesterase [Cunninghamella echinulata]